MAEKKFSGRTFKTEPMLASRALVLQARIIKLIGPGVVNFKEIMASFGSEANEEKKAEGTAFAIKALTDIFSAAEPEAMVGLLKDILQEGMILRPSGSYDPVDLDGDFINHQGDIFPVVAFILLEQFSSFFTGLRGIGNLKSKLTG